MADITGTNNSETLTGTEFDDNIDALAGDDVLRGLGGNDTLWGREGFDVLDGGTGTDTMYGGPGDDTYYVDVGGHYQSGLGYIPGDQAIEAASEGYDRVVTSVNYSLGDNIDRLESVNLTAVMGLTLGGNAENNTIIGDAGHNVINGYGGDDVLIGGAGADDLWGGAGNDTYYVDNAGDQVLEDSRETSIGGVDRVFTSVSFDLTTNGRYAEQMETVDVNATTAIDLTGNGYANVLVGNAGTNILRGLDNNDSLFGMAGNDYLDGGPGADAMYGGLGDDTYYVDDAGDLIFENAGEGVDRVAASTTFFLTATPSIELLETVSPSGTDRIDLSGSGTDNHINGNEGMNILYGQGGNDTLYGYGGDDYLVGGTGSDAMYGGIGNDTYYVDSSSDYAYEAVGEGNDRIATSVSIELSGVSEIETLEVENSTSTDALVLTGSDLANRIVGNAGDNVINGRGGSDVLAGLGGADSFQFTTALGSGNVDTVADFQPGSDKIALSHTVFSYYNPGSLDPATFHLGSAAADWDDLVIYDSGTGALYYDADGVGAGAQVQFATLQSGLALTASDFMVI